MLQLEIYLKIVFRFQKFNYFLFNCREEILVNFYLSWPNKSLIDFKQHPIIC